MLYYYYSHTHITPPSIMTEYTLDKEVSHDLRELMEDSLEFFCDNNRISGELAWTVVSAIAEAKLMEIRGHLS